MGEYLAVFFTVQYLAGINAVVSIIGLYKFQYFASLARKLANAYSRPHLAVLGALTAKWRVVSTKSPNGRFLSGNTS